MKESWVLSDDKAGYRAWRIVWSFFTTLGEGGGGSFLVHLVLLAVVGLLGSQHHCGLACSLGVVVPDGSILGGFFLLAISDWFFIGPTSFLLTEVDAGLVMVGVEAWMGGCVPLELLGLLKTSRVPGCQPKDHWDWLVTVVFLGLSTKLLVLVFFPAGLSSIV